jgi:polyphenol oxidase
MVKSKILSDYSWLIHGFPECKDKALDFFSEYKNKEIISMEQIHGNNVVYADGYDKNIESVDGLITDKRLILTVRTADCLPVFIVDSKKKVIAAVHAGWKGIIGGIINSCISEFRKLNSNPENCKVAVGPHIRQCCFEVNKEVSNIFKNIFGDSVININDKKKDRIDLAEIVRLNLVQLGIPLVNIDIINICTKCNKNYYSFRRNAKDNRRMINYLGII